MSSSNASVIDSNFFNCGSVGRRIAVGAVLLGNQSSLDVSRSDFFDLESRDGAVVAKNNSSVSITDSTFTKTNGINGAAISVSSGGKAELQASRFEMCASSKQSAISMIGSHSDITLFLLKLRMCRCRGVEGRFLRLHVEPWAQRRSGGLQRRVK